MKNQHAGWNCQLSVVESFSFVQSFLDRKMRSLPESSRFGLARARGLVAAAFMLAAAIGAHAQAPTLQPEWNQLSPVNSPSARDTSAMAYDSRHNQLVMFGGFNGNYLNDTWLWNGATWTQANPGSSPSPCSNELMAFDATTGNTVLFGGLYNASVRYADTWLWDGSTWTQQSPSVSPPGRASGAIVYDPATGNVVMFGGLDTNGGRLGDTWLWNGSTSTWTQATPSSSPSARYGASMAYDAANSRVILVEMMSTEMNSTIPGLGTA
jgi:hypothetical protein